MKWCECGQPWVPAVGLYGTTEETRCPACVLRGILADEREELVRLKEEARLSKGNVRCCDRPALETRQPVRCRILYLTDESQGVRPTWICEAPGCGAHGHEPPSPAPCPFDDEEKKVPESPLSLEKLIEVRSLFAQLTPRELEMEIKRGIEAVHETKFRLADVLLGSRKTEVNLNHPTISREIERVRVAEFRLREALGERNRRIR